MVSVPRHSLTARAARAVAINRVSPQIPPPCRFFLFQVLSFLTLSFEALDHIVAGLISNTMASQAVKKAITEAALQYTKPEGKVFEYGTAGVGCSSEQMRPRTSRLMFFSFSFYSFA